jgi:GntR family transcriptional regulator/MocR family aminotransferase
LQSLDTRGRVVYAGSFSKTMLPALRLGFLVVPASIRSAVRSAKYVADWATSTPQQLALAQFIDRGWFARHLRAMRTLYRERHDLITAYVDAELPGVARVIPSAAGMHVSVLTPDRDPDDVTRIVRDLLGRGLAAFSLGAFGVVEPRPAGVVIGYGAIATNDIAEGMRRLAGALVT